MSTIRKVSLQYRVERTLAREKLATAAREEQQRLFLVALKAGQIKPPTPRLPDSARKVWPREELARRVFPDLNVCDALDLLAIHGHRVGRDKQYELQYYKPATRGKTYADRQH